MTLLEWAVLFVALLLGAVFTLLRDPSDEEAVRTAYAVLLSLLTVGSLLSSAYFAFIAGISWNGGGWSEYAATITLGTLACAIVAWILFAKGKHKAALAVAIVPLLVLFAEGRWSFIDRLLSR